MPTPTIHLLDGAHLRDGACRVDLPSSVPGFVIGYLAAQGDWVARETLAALLWPEHGTADAGRALRVSLHRAKAWLAEQGLADRLHAERRRVRLALACDVAQFRAAVGRGDWREALQLHRAPLMGGLVLTQHPVASEWVDTERPVLLEAWRRAAVREAARLEDAGQCAQAAELLIEQLHQDLLTEDILQALLRVAEAAGQRDAALALHAQFVERLWQQLGLAPLAQTQALATALRARAGAAGPREAGPAPMPRLGTPGLIGRAPELAQLQQQAEPGGIVLVTGEPGIGKTLVLEQGVPQAAWIACREDGRAAPLQPVIDYLDDTLESLQDLPAFVAHRSELARVLPRAAAGERLPPAALSPAATTPQARERLLDALADLLLALSRPIVVDDLQWADETSLDLLELLCRRGALLFIAVRSTEIGPTLQDRLDRWAARGPLRRVPLPPLDTEAITQLIARLLPAGADPPPQAPVFARWLHDYTGGNPLFAIETLRGLAADQRLRSEAGRWRTDLDALSRDYAQLTVSGRLADLVRRRVGALADTTQRAITVAAIAGDARHVETLADVAGLSAWAMAEAVGKAQEAGLLDGRRFAHDLVREAIVQATPEALRSVLHGSIARHCEHLIPAHRVAQHWWAAQRPAPAVAALQRACAEDRARGLHSEVATTLGRWLERVDALPLRARLHAELALTHQQADDVTGAEAQVLLALDSLPEPAARSTALCVRAELAFRQGRMQAALDAIEEAEAAAPEHFEVLSTQSRIAMAAGQPDRALGAMRQAERLLRQRPPGPELATALTAIGALLDTKGDVQGGLPLHREAWRLARRLGARYVQVEVATNMVWSMPTMNLHAEAVEIAREALALGEFDGTQTLRNNLAWLLADMGRPGDALPLYEQLADSDDPTLRCVALSQLIRVQAARGDAPGTAGAIESTLAALAATDVYLAHAAAIAAVLDHGTPEQARRALAWLRDDDLDPYLARVLQKALENHAERERLAGN